MIPKPDPKSLLTPLLLLSLTAAVRAEEGGSGHYLPGAAASFIDALPGRPSVSMVDFFTYYQGNAGISRNLPIAGLTAAGLDAEAEANSVGVFWETPLEILGGNYAIGAVVPYVWMNAEADVTVAGRTARWKDSENGVGDITFFPFMLGWTRGTDLKYDVRFAVYAPTGGYDAGSLANVGKNYWTFEPGASISWLSSKIGLEVSAFAGIDFNTRNDDTDYTTGTQAHLDFTVAEHLPLGGGFVGIGFSGFYYDQITGDSGSGARFGDFEGRTLGVGPVLSYATKLCGEYDLVTEIKWLPELDVAKRTEGDYVWCKLALVF